MAILGGQAVGVPSFLSSSSYHASQSNKITQSPSTLSTVGSRLGASRRIVACSAVQESSAAATPTTTVATSETASAETKEAKAAPKEAAAKPKRPAKAPVKPLPLLMEEEVIPQLKEILQAQEDLSEIELTFQDNRLEGSFLKKGNPHSFWAFFPNGDLTGPKGFSLSSYGSGASTVEPFLVDEKKITANLVIFWVEKRLAAQGIIPVWKE
ncbi:uncharacterized protein LOC116214256 isoform X2 [Punica granatum]|uniref:Uncharacterized protein n=2 Tax=Punica granatum TaxID=22663 RepID=A0A218VQD2_PUNGR|nr:uncharacterized protein LOC116214256 isoform X2 [Punica granatum]OWM62705.1 hypothetical protein CDL15_Pgr019999 [Punica granatum]PKI63298.1 hypothetical protein CRG98_016289 [Punica granatum]